MAKNVSPMTRNFMSSNELEELCFKEWTRLGTLSLASKALAERGILTSGKRHIDPSSMYKKAYHWLAFHPNAARKQLSDVAGIKFADDDWINYWVIKSFLGLVIESEVITWIREYGVVFSIDKNQITFPPDSDTER